jgi:hypothetical protein
MPITSVSRATSRSSSAELPTVTPWMRISLCDTISASANRLSKAGLKICTFCRAI